MFVLLFYHIILYLGEVVVVGGNVWYGSGRLGLLDRYLSKCGAAYPLSKLYYFSSSGECLVGP